MRLRSCSCAWINRPASSSSACSPCFRAVISRGTPLVLDDDAHEIPKPYRTAVSRNHAVLEIMVPLLLCRQQTMMDSLFAVVRVNVVCPERELSYPLIDRVSENALRLLADEGELQRARVGLPDDPFNRVHQVAEALLRCDRFGMGLGQIGGSLAHLGVELVTRLLERPLRC